MKWLLLPLSYLLGAFPTGYLFFKRASRQDIRKFGSGATGATNVLRLKGWRLAVPVVVIDVIKEYIAVKEANRLGIPVFAMVDTNSNPRDIDYVIPANDDAKDSIEVVLNAICGAIAEGLEERKVEKADEKASDEQAEEASEGRHRSRRARKDENVTDANDTQAKAQPVVEAEAEAEATAPEAAAEEEAPAAE